MTATTHPTTTLGSLWTTALRGRPLSSLLVALFLQFAPLLRTIEPAVTGLLQPVFILLRWASAATALAGGAHALSGATGLTTAASVRGTNGIPLSYRVGITSDSHGTAEAYTASGLPTGVSVTSRTGGVIGGTPSRAGVFAARVTGWENSNASGDSYTATVTFTIVDPAPAITTQPQPATVTVGDAVTFSVTATGGTLTYRWLHDDLEIANATNATLTLGNVQLSNAGNYQVRVSNSGGTLLSSKALLTVNPGAQPPTFTAVSPDTTAHEGDTLVLTAAATATGGAPSIAWLFQGNPIEGATGPSLQLLKVTAGQAGTYRAVATANGLSTTSAPVQVTVIGAPRIQGSSTDGTRFTITFQAINGRRYRLESATDPTATNWTTRAQATANGSAGLLDDANLDDATRFYRLLAE